MTTIRERLGDLLSSLGVFILFAGLRIAGTVKSIEELEKGLKTVLELTNDRLNEIKLEHAAAAEGRLYCDVCGRALVRPHYVILVVETVGGRIFRTCSRAHAANVLTNDLVGRN